MPWIQFAPSSALEPPMETVLIRPPSLFRASSILKKNTHFLIGRLGPLVGAPKGQLIQNEFMRSSFLTKSQPKIAEISALEVY